MAKTEVIAPKVYKAKLADVLGIKVVSLVLVYNETIWFIIRKRERQTINQRPHRMIFAKAILSAN